MPKTYTCSPDYAVPPGDTLKELLETKSISQADLACRTGLTEKMISQIINATTPITYEVAAKFELAIGVPARFWNNRELIYRENVLGSANARSRARFWNNRELIYRENVLGSANARSRARFWNNRELIYREALVRIEETKRLEGAIAPGALP